MKQKDTKRRSNQSDKNRYLSSCANYLKKEKELIILQMINYLKKYKPDATFNKFIVRV